MPGKVWKIKQLKESISTLSKRLDDLNYVISRQKQCRNCLLSYGLEEERKHRPTSN